MKAILLLPQGDWRHGGNWNPHLPGFRPSHWMSTHFTPTATNPVTPFGIPLSLQLITAWNWKEAGMGGAQSFYKEQRNLLTENSMRKQLHQTLAAGRAKKEVNWGAQRQVQCKHCFPISRCEQPWEELLPSPIRQSSSWLAFTPWACRAVEPRAVPLASLLTTSASFSEAI